MTTLASSGPPMSAILGGICSAKVIGLEISLSDGNSASSSLLPAEGIWIAGKTAHAPLLYNGERRDALLVAATFVAGDDVIDGDTGRLGFNALSPDFIFVIYVNDASST